MWHLHYREWPSYFFWLPVGPSGPPTPDGAGTGQKEPQERAWEALSKVEPEGVSEKTCLWRQNWRAARSSGGKHC